MKKMNFLCLIVLGVFFSACDTDDDPWGDWEKSDAYPGDNRVLAVAFQHGENVYVGMGYNNLLSTSDKYLNNFYKFNGTSWTNIADNFPAAGREGCVAFVIGDTAYVGAGYREKQIGGNKLDTYFSDFYKFVLSEEEWAKSGDEYLRTDIADYVRGDDSVSSQFYQGIAFELGGKGYVGTGLVDGRVSKSIFRYEPATGKWTSSSMAGDPRAGSVVFKLGEKVVVCLGTDGSTYNRGVYTFDGNAEMSWVAKEPLVDVDGDFNNDYNEIPRSNGVAFTLDAYFGLCGYIAGGSSNSTVWRYNLERDRWHEVEEFSRSVGSKVGAVGFAIGNAGYITTGGPSTSTAGSNSTWKFIPDVDEDDGNDY